MNSSVVESEGSLSDEYDLVLEEIHAAEDTPIEDSDAVISKNSTANKELIGSKSTYSDDDLNCTKQSLVESFIPTVINGTVTFNKGLQNIVNKKFSENDENRIVDLKRSTDMIDAMNALPSEKGERITNVCNGTVMCETNDKDDKNFIKIEKYPESIGEKVSDIILQEDANSRVKSEVSSDERITSSLQENGNSSSIHDSVLSSNQNSVDVSSPEKNMNGNCDLPEEQIKICEAAGRICDGSISRKRNVDEPQEISSVESKNICDNEIPDSVLGIKKRKMADISNQEICSSSSISDKEKVEVNNKISNCELSKSENTGIKEPLLDDHKIPCTECNDEEKLKIVVKKNIARKHTTPVNVMKTMQDLEAVVRNEINERQEKEQNGFIEKKCEEVSDREHTDDKLEMSDSKTTDSHYKVNISVDSLSNDTLRSIFKTMRRTLTRRQLEEIVLQKVCEMISDSSEIGELKKQIQDLQQAEAHRKLTCFNLEKQIHQLKGVCQVFIEKANNMKKDGKAFSPTMITRSVGLQVMIDSPPATSYLPLTSSEGTNSKFLNSSNNGNSRTAASGSADTRLSTVDRTGSSLNRTPSSSRHVEDPSIIDLTDKEDKNEDLSNSSKFVHSSQPSSHSSSTMKVVAGAGIKPFVFRPTSRHPAPLPKTNIYTLKPGIPHPPPKPELMISRNNDGISLSWNLPLNQNCAKIARYQIYAYQETNSPLVSDPWKPVGEVNALPLPMECTLTQFFTGYRYHFTVRAVDELKRVGPFSEPSSIAL